ncbi:hypothetical protein FACS189465_1390 [Clostridia bacterium]|nr:hypothetical protein FACS189465_1390 [Clostridia bacterium]
MYEIIFFEKDNGEIPAEDFIKTLEKKMRTKVLKTIKILKENGTNLREPYSSHLDDGIFELRIQFGSDITRVLYFFLIGKKIVLTNGFAKKTQKTPKPEIDKAKKYRKQYILKGE